MPIQFHSHPATRQDEWLIEKMVKSDLASGGFFVDIGAHDGLRYSNTLMLEQHFGWSGLLVEANPQLYVDCRKNRLARSVPICVSDKIGHDQNFVVGDAYSGLTEFMPKEWLAGHSARNNPQIRVSTMTLSRLLQVYTGEDYCIDFLSLDVEGAELPILRTWMRSGCNRRINYLSVEFRYDHALLMELERLLEPVFYLDQVRGFDACFINRKLGENRVPRTAPLEILATIVLFYCLFYLFRKLLNSKKLTSVIEEVAHPAAVTEDEVVEQVETVLSTAKKRVARTDEEIAKRAEKNERLRKSYGGK